MSTAPTRRPTIVVDPADEPPPPYDPAAPAISPLRKAAILLVSLEESLAGDLLTHLERESVEAVTLEMAHLDRVDPAEQRSVLEEFYAQGVRRLRFLFDDVVRMDDTDLREAFHEEDAPTWALALAGSSRPVQCRVLEALAPASAAALRRRLERIGPFRLDQAEAAQADLCERLRRLHDHGRITLPDPDGQEEFLV
jgi:flagellar motor switch protein FliG